LELSAGAPPAARGDNSSAGYGRSRMMEPKREVTHIGAEERPQEGQRSGHSLLGISSFVLSLLSIGALVLAFIVAAALEASSPGSVSGGTGVAAILLGLVMTLMSLGALVSIGLGVAGVIQNQKKRVFAVLGICFSVAYLVLFTALMIYGNATG
jgi:hypothetical protein